MNRQTLSRITVKLLIGLVVISSGCGGGGGGSGTPGPVNAAPAANAGSNQTVDEQTEVTLTGSGADNDGTIQSYSWTQVSGSTVTLDDPDATTTTFTAPDVASESAELVFQLTVTDNQGATATDEVSVTVMVIPTVSGRVTFDYVPLVHEMGVRLDYNATEARPVRGVTVQLREGDELIDTTITDEHGHYRLTVKRDLEVFLRVLAEIAESKSSWDARVLDNTQEDALYAIDGESFNSGEADVVRDLHAASGWAGSGYGEDRVAAPFAVLDVVYDAMQLVWSADPDLDFPTLKLYWSPNNVTMTGDNGPDIDSGQLGGSFYRRNPNNPESGLYLLGEENEDTDEYDRPVIAHEWAHYLEDNLSRSDSIGGPHALHEQLDMRVAFSEGLANALAVMVTENAVYADSLGPQQGSGFSFSVEGDVSSTPRPGWFSESSMAEILYDLFDPPNDDQIELGFAPLFIVLANDLRETAALTSIFPFIDALKIHLPGDAAAIDVLLGAHSIDPIVDIYGSTETNSGHPPNPDVLPIYSDLTVNGGAVNVCSTNDFEGFTGPYNKLGSRRYIKVTAATTGSYTVSATTTSAPEGEYADPDFVLYKMGFVGASRGLPSEDCTPENVTKCIESLSTELPAGETGDYVIEVYEWTNTSIDSDYPPIGRTCFDVEVITP